MTKHFISLALISVSFAIGLVGLSSLQSLSALILAVPVLWTFAGSRYTAFLVMFAYNLAASRGLFHGAAVFLSNNHTAVEAACLWVAWVFGLSLPFEIFWSDKRKRRAIALVLAFMTTYVIPPFSLIGILNLLAASGWIFPNYGFGGLLAMIGLYALCVADKRFAAVMLCVIALMPFEVGVSDSEGSVSGFMSINASFGKLGSGSFAFESDFARASMVFADLKKRVYGTSPDVIVLPETIAGRLNQAGLELWKNEIRQIVSDDTAVIFGAELPVSDGRKYDNAALMLYKGNLSSVRQRIPVPYSMWRPFSETGANLHMLDGGVLVLPDGRRAAVVICYESFLTWPWLISMIHKPDVIISIANLWWCKDTSIPVSMERFVQLWGRLFGVSVVMVRNM
ncbi:putative conjugal transfer protein TraB [Synergistales bacterium]|nr:putative conjugal transfer protein TraB [Synergistales bacterium]